MIFEALLISNPDFLKHITREYKEKNRLSEKTKSTLHNYLFRMTFRSTPFGLFSSIGNHNKSDFEIDIDSQNKINRNLRICEEWLTEYINSLINVSHYFKNMQVKINPKVLVEANYLVIEDSNHSKINTVKISKLLSFVIELLIQKPLTILELSQRATEKFGFKIENYIEYFKKLYQENILISELNETISYDAKLNLLSSFLENHSLNSESQEFNKVLKLINDYNNNELNSLEILKKICDLMDNMLPNSKSKVYVRSSNQSLTTEYLKSFKSNIHTLLDNLNWLLVSCEVKELENIKEFYLKNFNENDEINLLEFLYNPFIEEYTNFSTEFIPREDYEDRLNLIEGWIDKTIFLNEKTLKLDDNKLKILNDSVDQKNITNFSLVVSKNRNKVILNNNLTGVQTKQLMGRFYDLFDDYEKPVETKEIYGSSYRQIGLLSNSNKDFKANNLIGSELINSEHLNLGYENASKIELKDILIGLEKNEIYLKHKPTNDILIIEQNDMLFSDKIHSRIEKFHKIILSQYFKYHSTIFNYIREREFTPRIVIGNIVLSPAKYLFKITNNNLSDSSLKEKLTEFIHYYNVPNYVYIENFGEKQILNLKNSDDFKRLIKEIQTNKKVLLNELIIEKSKNNTFTEYIFNITKDEFNILHKNNTLKQMTKVDSKYISKIQKDTISFKIYLRENYIDTLIRELPALDKESDVSYFFVRYFDPQPHLRIRFIGNWDKISKVEFQRKIHDWINILKQKIPIESVVFDELQPEVNRYGGLKTYQKIYDYFNEESKLITYFYKKESITIEKTLYILYKILFAFYEDNDEIIRVLSTVVKNSKVQFSQKQFQKNIIYKTVENFHKLDGLVTKNDAERIEGIVRHLANISLDDLETNLEESVILSVTHMFLNRVGIINLNDEILYYRALLRIVNKLKYTAQS